MFTGIVEETGTVERAERRGELLSVDIAARSVLRDLAEGGSVAVDGCCLTAVSVTGTRFTCELGPETLARTAFLRRLRPGVLVNLERPVRLGDRMDGHLVQGHVDGIGRVRSLAREGDTAVLTVAPPPELQRYLVSKGSVTVDGVSLTVASLEPHGFTVALIPYTLGRTNLGDRREGDDVNLETDVVAKYVERLLSARP
jgi:riboflavin synthase